ncbi:hypothetical protein F5Y13DRAFT_183172 [Hypoxylon sp. FL1857]|nr:hypothetical protein F5Y13DRAFT_183172 [Hypoxylon sp. FL1857]
MPQISFVVYAGRLPESNIPSLFTSRPDSAQTTYPYHRPPLRNYSTNLGPALGELSLSFILPQSERRDRRDGQTGEKHGMFIPVIVSLQCAMVTNHLHCAETERRPRWKDHEDVIRFILRRTIPDHPVPRGEIKNLYHSVAEEVKKTFRHLNGLIDYTGMKYVTEKYGSDPTYGNRKMKVVYPARPQSDKTPRASNTTLGHARRVVKNGGGRFILCSHCNGHGYLDVSEAGLQVGSKPQDDPEVGSTHHSRPPQVVLGTPYPGPGNVALGANPTQPFGSSANVSGYATASPPAAHVPSIHQGLPHLNTAFQRLAEDLLPRTSSWSNDNAYGGAQDVGGLGIQMPRTPDARYGNSNMVSSEPQAEQYSHSGIARENQQTSWMPQAAPVVPSARHSTTATADPILYPSYGQMGQGAIVTNNQARVSTSQAGTSFQAAQPNQLKPMPMPMLGPARGESSQGGPNAIPLAPDIAAHGHPSKRPRTEDRADEGEMGYRRGSAAQYGRFQTGEEPASKRHRAITAEQSSMMSIGQDQTSSVGLPSGQQAVTGGDAGYFLNTNFLTGNAASGHNLDYPPLDPRLLDPNHGGSTDHHHASGVLAPAGFSAAPAPPAMTQPAFDFNEVDFAQFLEEYGNSFVPDPLPDQY